MSEAPPSVADGPPLPGDAGPRTRLPVRTQTYWRVRAALIGGGLLVLAVVGAVLLSWPAAWLRWTVVGVLAVAVAVATTIAPTIRWRVFWYAVSENEVDVQSGWFFRTRTVVPMNRVQHLQSDRGPVADKFHLANVHIHTAAGPVTLEGLDRDEADRLRQRISALAHLADDV